MEMLPLVSLSTTRGHLSFFRIEMIDLSRPGKNRPSELCRLVAVMLLSSKVCCAFVAPHLVRSPFLARFATTRVGSSSDEPYIFNGTVTVLELGEHYVVVAKPPSVVCHHSDWSGSRSKDAAPEIPMLQRTREAIGERVNLVHRLDRGASGCLLLTKAASDHHGLSATATLQEAMAQSTSRKTYIALVRGEGILNGTDFRKQGWFTVDRPIKDESGKLNNATTHFRFLAGQDNGGGTIDRPRASLVLARPDTGRWHQIRRHLNGLSHPILGDTTHGDNRVNRSWRNDRGMLPERTCLHLAKLEIAPNAACPQGITVTCPLARDMMAMLQLHLPDVLRDAQVGLAEEGIDLFGDPSTSCEIPVQIVLHVQP